MPDIERGDQGGCPDCNALGECTTECREVDHLPVIERKVTITLYFDDTKWNERDAKAAAAEAAQQLANIAAYHPGGKVALDGLRVRPERTDAR